MCALNYSAFVKRLGLFADSQAFSSTMFFVSKLTLYFLFCVCTKYLIPEKLIKFCDKDMSI